MRKIIFDCDPGVDDATALFLAFAARDAIDILAVTTVAGNVGLDLTTRNACIIRQMAGRETIPVYAGCSRPLVRPPVAADDFHGASGLGPLHIITPRRSHEIGHAVSFLADRLMREPPASVTLVITGPCTNVAAALALEPDIANRVAEIVVMGGARSEGGNITPSAEFNIYADPHAAAAVFSCGAPLTVFGLDVTHQLRTGPSRIAMFQHAGTPICSTISELFAFSNRLETGTHDNPGAPLHDPCPVAYLIEPGLFSFQPCHIAVETAGALTTGHTQVEFRQKPPGFNARWAVKANADRLFELLLAQVRTL